MEPVPKIRGRGADFGSFKNFRNLLLEKLLPDVFEQMRFVLAVVLAPFLFISASPDTGGRVEACSVRWLTPVQHDFGDIEQGKPVTVGFRFKNESGAPIRLETARSTCGCTAPTWTDAPIAPGAEGEILIEYDAYRHGRFKKKVMVFFECRRKPYLLYIKGKVE